MTIYVFEGPDGVGKTYCAETISKELHLPLFSFPGKHTPGSLGKIVYDIHHDIDININMLALQTMHVAAHIDLLLNHILPIHEQGIDIIMDRCWASTVIYGALYIGDTQLELRALECVVSAEKYIWNTIPHNIYVLQSEQSFRNNVRDFDVLKEIYSRFAHQDPNSIALKNDGTRYPIDFVIEEIKNGRA